MKSNDTYLNILISFAYAGTNQRFTDSAFQKSMAGDVNLMLDSGAFTLFNAKQNRDWLTLDNYCKYLEQYGSQCEKYVMLDVIGNHEKSKQNYEVMVKRGLSPMFVFTMADDDYSYLKDTVKINRHICVAGGVTSKGKWMKKRFQDVYRHTNGLIHGLGYVAYPSMYQLPLHSVDSSSWVQGAQVYGHIVWFEGKKYAVHRKELLKKNSKMPMGLIKVLEELKITPSDFQKEENHRGSSSIGALLSVLAYVKFQKYSKRLGLDLFLAIANVEQLEYLFFVANEYETGNLTYERWKNYKKIQKQA